jgi:hypothetical protein
MHHFRKKHSKIFKAVFACLTIVFCLFMVVPVMAQDPGGTKTGTLGDIDTMAVKVLDTVANAKDTTVAAVSSHVSKLAATVQTIGAADGHNNG